MPLLPRLATVSALLLGTVLAGITRPAAAQDMAGSWIGWVCPTPGPADASRCASFSLRLYQKQGRLCGSHVFATAGARQMDEGGAPSVLASIEGQAAQGTVDSVRTSPPVRIPVTLTLSGGELRWQRLANPEGDYLLPMSASLQRVRQGGLLSPVFEQRLSSACSAFLELPAASDKPAPLPVPK